MGLPRKCDARHLSTASPNKSQPSCRPVSKAIRTSSFKIEPDATRTNRETFAEDFLLEHSHSTLRLAVIEITASASATPREPQQSAQSFGFPS